MSRDIPGHDVTQIYQISQQWKDDCLLGNNSLFFSDENVWNKDSVGELIVILEEEEISSSKQWRKKLNDQVNNSSNCAKKLAVEVMFVMYLAAWGGSYSKRTWSSQKSDLTELLQLIPNFNFDDSPLLRENLLIGIGDSGQHFHSTKFGQNLNFFLKFLLDIFKIENVEKRRDLFGNGFEFAKKLDNMEISTTPQFRHMLVHLLFPDDFERVFSGQHKNKIFQCYENLINDGMSDTWLNIDKALRSIRERLSQERGFRDFYEELFYDEWFNGNPPNGRCLQLPENIIFFGPPGTGKTFHMDEEKKNYVAKLTSEDEWLKEQLRSRKWFDVIFMVLYELKSANTDRLLEHQFIEVMKKISSAKGKNFRAVINNTLRWHSNTNSDNVSNNNHWKPYVFDRKSDKKTWILSGDYEDECAELIELKNELDQVVGNQNHEEIKRYKYVTFHQAYSYEDFVEGIRPTTEDDSSDEIKYEVKHGVFRQICERAEEEPDHKFALFIDEINRGNVAKIIGELITLIEPDKRVGKESEIKVTLPYSGDEFGVPANLDIYGTMNSADRSITSLDTALRRRFQFKEISPDASKIGGCDGNGNVKCKDGENVNLRKLLDTINKRIEFLLERNFKLGHSFFMCVENFDQLREIFLHRVIPLLQEYFYDDWRKIQLVLNEKIILGEENKAQRVFLTGHEEVEESRLFYRVVDRNNFTCASLRNIYKNTEESNL